MSEFTTNGNVLIGYNGTGGDVRIPAGITEIGEWAFAMQTAITSVTIPATVTTIGELAFEGCTALSTVTTQGALTLIGREAFSGCTALSTLTLGGGVETIDEYAFFHTSLTRVDLPAGTRTIASRAFEGCTALSELSLPDSLTELADDALAGCPKLRRLLAGKSLCETLLRAETTRVVLGYLSGAGHPFTDADNAYFDDLIRAQKHALLPFILEDADALAGFAARGYIREEEYDKLIARVAEQNNEASAFTLLKARSEAKKRGQIARSIEDRPQVEMEVARTKWTWDTPTKDTLRITSYKDNAGEVTVPAIISGLSVLAIGEDCFSPKAAKRSDLRAEFLAGKLTRVKLPVGIERIEARAFRGCTALSHLTTSYTLTEIGESAFAESGLTQISLPERLTTLGGGAFAGCKGLTHVTLPAGVTSLGKVVFQACTALTELAFPASLAEIPDGTCFRCTALREVTLADGITAIGDFAFSDCTALTKVHIPASVTTIADFAFAGCKSLTIYGEKGSVAEKYAEKNNLAFVRFS